jgi:glycosyltransferase involved in cell wall biosynthesis
VKFLVELATHGFGVSYVEPHVRLDPNGNLQDGELPASLVRAIDADKRSPFKLWRAAHSILSADFLYVFYPGTVPRIAAALRRQYKKPYAIYVRGERFDITGADASNLRNAEFICCVAGLDSRLASLNSRVIPIRPMLDLVPGDGFRRNFIDRDASPWRLLFVGRLETSKGVPELLEAAEILRSRGLHFELTLVGGGPLHSELAARYGNASGAIVKVTGMIKNKAELHALYERTDLFVLPSHHEGFPRVLYEAMMKSNVILTTFVGGIPGLLREGKEAARLPVGDAFGIANVIERTVSDRHHMQALANAGYEIVHKVLTQNPTHLAAVLRGFNVRH